MMQRARVGAMALAVLLSLSGAARSACLDGTLDPGEQCDDGNAVETDGCTSLCRTGVVCDAVAFPGADRFAVEAQSGGCYVSFDDDWTTFQTARSACEGIGGDLVTITSSAEDAIIRSVQNPAQNPWIGATDVAAEGNFAWVTGEAFGYSNFALGQPDDDPLFGGADCVHIADSLGGWNDTSCDFVGFVTGRICEVPEPGMGMGLFAGSALLRLFAAERRRA